jgi:hypothetical protein
MCSLIVFIISALVSMMLDTIAYYVRFVPSDNISIYRYFERIELLTSATFVGIIVSLAFNLFIWKQK